MATAPLTKGQRRARILAAATVLWILTLVALIALGQGRGEASSAVAGRIDAVAIVSGQAGP